MPSIVKPIPDGFDGATPYLCCRDAARAIEFYARAFGATVSRPPTDEFYGDRSAALVDPYGHRWMFATHKEDVAPEEMGRRYAAMMKK